MGTALHGQPSVTTTGGVNCFGLGPCHQEKSSDGQPAVTTAGGVNYFGLNPRHRATASDGHPTVITPGGCRRCGLAQHHQGGRSRGPWGQVSTSTADDPGGPNPLAVHGSIQTADFNIVTQVATLTGVRCYWVSARTGRPGVSMLRLCEIVDVICSLCLNEESVPFCERACPCDTLAGCWDVKGFTH